MRTRGGTKIGSGDIINSEAREKLLELELQANFWAIASFFSTELIRNEF